MTAPMIYLGPVGNLQAFPLSGRGIVSADLDLGAAEQRALGGARTVDYVGDSKRTFVMDGQHWSADELGVLEGLALGWYGPRPLVLLDPARENLLSPNQSSGTDAEADTSGFDAATGTLSSSTAQARSGTRSLAWAVTAANQIFDVADVEGNVNVDPDVDTPVLAGALYRATVRARLSASTGSLSLRLVWYTSAGVYIGETVGSTIALSSSDWTRVTVTATAPATAALCRIRVLNPVMGAAQTIYLDNFTLAMLDGPQENLLVDGSFDDTSGTVVTRTNVFPNPVAANDAVSWASYAGTGGTRTAARQTGQSGWTFGVTTSYRSTWTVASSAVNGGIFFGSATANEVPVTAGRTYSFFTQVRCSKVQRVRASVAWYDAANAALGGSVNGSDVVLAATTVAAVTVTGLAPANATHAVVTVYSTAGTSGTNWAIADWLEATNAHVEETDVTLGTAANSQTAIFNGATATATNGADYTYTWSGTAHASTSEQRAPALVAHARFGIPVGIASRSTERALYGTGSMRVLWASSEGNNQAWGQTVANLVVGQTYTISAWLYIPTGSPNVGVAGSGISGSPLVTVRDQWVQAQVSFTATLTSHLIYFAYHPVSGSTAVKGDDMVYVDGATLTPGDPGAYADPPEVIGTGVPRVAFTALGDSYPLMGSHDVAMTLVEL